MRKAIASAVATLGLVLCAPAPAAAQERAGMVPLKIDLVISRHVDNKKVSSLPYTMWVTANAPTNRETSLRMGVEAPVPQNVSAPREGEKSSTPVTSYTYRSLGTNIDAAATSAPDGRYTVAITLNDSGISSKETPGLAPGAPIFRTFQSRFFLLLKDGQSAAYTSATDPVTGETLRVDVTMNVLR